MMKRSEKKLPMWVTATVVGGTFAALVVWELRRPLRRGQRENKARRDARNLTIAGSAALALSITEMPVAAYLTKTVEENRIGLVKIVSLPVWLETAAAVLLMDYTFYLWHVMTHKIPFLWRFHLMHHVDLDMDATTAWRFHAVDMAISTVFRAAQIIVIGTSPFAFSIWQTFMLTEVLLHHSNIELPETIEMVLVKFIVTPRMHDIHHRAAHDKTDSNWSSGFSFWDRIHGTWRADFSLKAEPIGVAAYQEPAELTLPQMMRMPFEPEREAWHLPLQKFQQNAAREN